MGLVQNCVLSLWISCFWDLRDWSYHFFIAFCSLEGAPLSRNCTTCLVSSRSRLEKSLTRVSMSGFATLVLASKSWICSMKAGDDKRSLRRSTASGDQLNFSSPGGLRSRPMLGEVHLRD